MAEEPRRFEDFFGSEHARLFGALCLVTGDRHEAEEIMQDAFLRLWERWEKVRGLDDPSSYLFRTAMNVFRNRYRRTALGVRRTLSLAPNEDAFATVEGSNYSLLPIDDPTLQVGAGGWSPDGSRFVAGAWDDTDPSREGLYTFRSTDGGGLVRLTAPANPPHDYAVDYSPDGSKVLFIREKRPYDHSGPMDVFVVNKDGSDLVRVNPPGTTSLLDGQSWSPDGRQVAFVASKDAVDAGNAVFVVNADGTDAHRITPWSVTLRADWSPDGEWIAFDMAESEPVPRDLFVVHPDGSELTRITSNEDNKMSFAPAWSPDGQTLLFIRREYTADGVDLWTADVDGTGMSLVTDQPAEYTGYRWLPETG